ncbi:serine/threonine protein phosphatase [Rhodobacter sp. NTK016B]|uniref:metallophosphoesterase family protein n=1 Tax=Rhodobacter sp. NTK016B TaxID=2759676 RepID=UPI001A8F5597|nr:metallophosphoesterase family protein [Rhodobacter sp. NTK016B]MBN8293321.1 serine/threonine protein phosphatase [Rhodobacter sp. NTK016B]
MTPRCYAIGDIHGQLDKLHAAHARIMADRARTGDAEAPVIHLGDLVDRGPDSRGVIDHLLKGQFAGQPWVVLKGNHDRMFGYHLEGQRDPALRAGLTYLDPRIGGRKTLESYDIDPELPAPRIAAAVPEAHRDFIASLPCYHQTGELLFVHAGIRPGVALDDQTENDLVWIRAPFLDFTGAHPWLVIHGHTTCKTPEHHGNRVDIDTGAGYDGPLTAIVVEGREIFVLTDEGRVPLRPDAG